eukprot:CAMPEP_0119362762 /NCGR_PEP_ID=MMETSP1334-20130426/9721_1 /TAXON_ID=127549 /ORGANISM="Calcidiscus leptoporus, Strain RCC1130" /LENGTH=120 /DNA_ID=CAMNT_0007378013 /DNA_START=253 /DNA_END=616 /DNA_ORIENTATION=-
MAVSAKRAACWRVAGAAARSRRQSLNPPDPAIRKDEQRRAPQLLVVADVAQLITQRRHASSVHRIDDQHHGVRPHIVCAPYAPQLVLSAQVPHLEAHVPMAHLLDVRADGWLRLDHVSEV